MAYKHMDKDNKETGNKRGPAMNLPVYRVRDDSRDGYSIGHREAYTKE